MGMGFAPTWLRQVSPLLHKTTLTTDLEKFGSTDKFDGLERVCQETRWTTRSVKT